MPTYLASLSDGSGNIFCGCACNLGETLEVVTSGLVGCECIEWADGIWLTADVMSGINGLFTVTQTVVGAISFWENTNVGEVDVQLFTNDDCSETSGPEVTLTMKMRVSCTGAQFLTVEIFPDPSEGYGRIFQASPSVHLDVSMANDRICGGTGSYVGGGQATVSLPL